MHNAKNNKRMWSCNDTTIEHEGENCKSFALKGTFDAPALNFVASLCMCYFVWPRLGGDHADGRYQIPYVVGS